jgi:hypothetical protein
MKTVFLTIVLFYIFSPDGDALGLKHVTVLNKEQLDTFSKK